MSRIGYLQVELIAEQPFTISDPSLGAVVDRPVLVDSQGCVVAPATGLMGSLRAHMLDVADVETMLGSSFGGDSHAKVDPSALRALGTRVTDTQGSPVTAAALRRRSSTAIDAHRGAAKGQTLRTSEEAPAGTRITLWCEYDGEIPASLIEGVRSWEPEVGGGIGTGHGKALIATVTSGVLDLSRPDDLAVYLRGVTPESFPAIAVETTDVSGPVEDDYVIDLRAHIVDPLFTAGGGEVALDPPADAESGERPNVRSSLLNAAGEPILEGSSIRGVLRARVSYIVASVLAATDVDVTDAISTGDSVAADIFGSPSQRGLVSVETATIQGSEIAHRMHVAIDRFTGGAMPGLLFGELPVIRGEFDLRVRSLGIPAAERNWIETLLLAACADIHDGLVGLGAMTTRGYGTIRFTGEGDLAPPGLGQVLPLSPEIVEWLQARHTATEEVAAEPDAFVRQQAAARLSTPEQTTHSTSNTRPIAEEAIVRGGQFYSVGLLTWDRCAELVTLLGLTAMWSGLDGIQSGQELPAEATTGSHLWGWSSNVWLRGRVDSGTCYVSILMLGAATPPPVLREFGVAYSGTETVTISRAVPWGNDENRLSKSGKATMTRLDIEEQWTLTAGTWSPVTFLHLGAAAWA